MILRNEPHRFLDDEAKRVASNMTGEDVAALLHRDSDKVGAFAASVEDLLYLVEKAHGPKAAEHLRAFNFRLP